jgi:hypothetical protein
VRYTPDDSAAEDERSRSPRNQLHFRVQANVFLENGCERGQQFAAEGEPFPVGAIYVSESGGDPRAGPVNARSEISGNPFKDNWDGVALWENADRFCRPDQQDETAPPPAPGSAARSAPGTGPRTSR